jgi:transposase-like protein
MGAGRPSEYRPEFVDRAKEMCERGATDAQLADEFGVTVTTIYNWRNKFPDFLDAIKTNKAIADERVERSLYERATGYSRESVKIFCNKDGEVSQVPFIEHVAPDPTSMIFWLKNRKPQEWRDKVQTEISGRVAIGEVADPKDLTDEQLRDEILARRRNTDSNA